MMYTIVNSIDPAPLQPNNGYVAFIVLAVQAVLLPLLFWLGFYVSKDSFIKDENKSLNIFGNFKILGLIAASEGLMVRTWYVFIFSKTGTGKAEWHLECLLYVSLVILTVVTVTDLLEHIIANKVLWISLIIYTIITGISFFIDSDATLDIIKGSALGAVFSLVCFGLVYLISKGGLGAGDVKLAVLLGLIMTGQYSARTLLFGCLVGSAYAIVMLCRKKIKKKDAFPFGPFLYAGLAVTLIMG